MGIYVKIKVHKVRESFILLTSFKESSYCVVQSLSHVWLFATSRTAAFKAFLSFTISQSLLNGRKWRRTKEPLDGSERGEWKRWLKAQHSENEDHGIWSHHFMRKKMGKQWKQCHNLFWEAPKSLQMVTAPMKLKNTYSLEEKLWPT